MYDLQLQSKMESKILQLKFILTNHLLFWGRGGAFFLDVISLQKRFCYCFFQFLSGHQLSKSGFKDRFLRRNESRLCKEF